MSSLARSTQTTNPALESDPESWGSEWDNWFWTADPLPSDASWAAEEFADADDEDLDEFAALESAALDAMERYLIPADCALEPNTADGILHAGSDPDQCSCYSCTEIRTRRFSADY